MSPGARKWKQANGIRHVGLRGKRGDYFFDLELALSLGLLKEPLVIVVGDMGRQQVSVGHRQSAFASHIGFECGDKL